MTREVVYERNRLGKIETIKTTMSSNNRRLRAIVLLALDSGLRKSEILNLDWSDFDFEAEQATIRGTHTKTERTRLVPLSLRTIEELLWIRENLNTSKPFEIVDFKRSFETALKIAGISDLTFHDLRRSAITRWIQDGQPLALAGKVAGHSRIETTMKHYTAADAEIVKSFTSKINSRLSDKKE